MEKHEMQLDAQGPYDNEELPNWRYDTDVLQEHLQKAYVKGCKVLGQGRVADYIPELARADAYAFGLVAQKTDGTVIACGDVDTRFSIQSVGKVMSLAMALKLFGTHEVFSHVLMEPSGDSFSSIIKLDTKSDLPYNPMINAGAIQVVSLLVNRLGFQDTLQFARYMCMDPDIDLNEPVYRSEAQTGDRNRAIAYLLKSKGVLMGDPEETLDLYFKLCSLNVTAKSLATMGLVLANDGQNPMTGEHVIAPPHARAINSLMFTCGMYDGSGEFGVKVGIPAKSGVGGGIACSVKGRMGIGVYGPALDEKGNSVGGLAALEYLSQALHLHVFDYHPYIVDEQARA
ncbi:MAG: glutaminase A [Coriobacteriia bacterium]|nr:glutaminase A [Coriobacteriia bacterium]